VYRKSDKGGSSRGSRQEQQAGVGLPDSQPLYSVTLDPKQMRQQPQASFMASALKLGRPQVTPNPLPHMNIPWSTENLYTGFCVSGGLKDLRYRIS
jgi:hypothetical protein